MYGLWDIVTKNKSKHMKKIIYLRDDDDDSGGCVCGDDDCPGN